MDSFSSMFLVLFWCMADLSEGANVTTNSSRWDFGDVMAPKAGIPVMNYGDATSVDICRGIDCGTDHCYTFQPDKSRNFYPLCHDPLFYFDVDCDEAVCSRGHCMDDRCYCPAGNYGRNCEKTWTLCSGNPCRRQEVCVIFPGGKHKCMMRNTPVGHIPSVANGQLALQPLVPRAACIGVTCSDGFTCTIFTPNSGELYPLCYRPSSPLGLVECSPGVCGVGTCVNNRCVCPANVHGDRCETTFTGCSSNPCFGTSICITVSGGGYYCQPTPTITTTSNPTNACSANKCSKSSNCRCIPSCMHEFGYYCLSSEGYIGEHCDIGPPRVFCNDDNIRIEIPSAFLQEYAGASTTASIYMSTTLDGAGSTQSLCRAVSTNGMHIITVPAFSTLCGNTLISGPGRDVVYSNNIWVNNKPSSLYDLPRAVVNFTCSYQKEYSIVAALKPVVDKPRPQISGEMVARTSISLCKVSTCQDVCPRNLLVNHGAIYTVAETLHLSVNIDPPVGSYGESSLVAEVMDAHLSCSSNRAVTDRVLLKKGCTVARELNCLLGRRSDRSVCMSFRVPRLNGCTEFYIHVRMVLCNKANLEPYGCPDGTTYNVCRDTVQKRSVGDSDALRGADIHRFVGPIIITSAHDGSDRLSFHSDFSEPIFVTSNTSVTDIRLHPAVKSSSASGDSSITFPVLAIGLLFLAFVLLISVLFYRKAFSSP